MKHLFSPKLILENYSYSLIKMGEGSMEIVTPTPLINADVHEANLAKGMEHMRPYVSVPSTLPHHNPRASTATHRSSASPLQTAAKLTKPQDDSNVYGVPSATINPARSSLTKPTIANPERRLDPFQFGTRLLTPSDDIFAHNAWDHVAVDPLYASFAETQYDLQRSNPVSDFDKTRYNAAPAKAWDKFYSHNNANFFKDRKWLFQEFPSLREATRKGAGHVTVLEVGAGAGNTAFPLLRSNENVDLRVHAVDYAKKAVDVMRSAEAYDERYMQADVWDAAGMAEDGAVILPPGLAAGSVDVVVLIFIFSALAPEQWAQALKNIWAVLKPGGEILFRDYGRGDLAQVRFKKGRWLDENFYIRGDGTRVYFFEEEELRHIFGGRIINEEPSSGVAYDNTELAEEISTDGDQSDSPKFDILNLAVDRRMLVNRQRRLKMYRCWMQGRFRKPLVGNNRSTRPSRQ